MYYKKLMLLMGTVFVCANMMLAQDNQWTSSRPDGHAPISVMGDHYHKKGEIMFSYRFMSMWMDGNLQGSDDVSNEVIYQDFLIAPQEMNMNMHMLGIMYAPSDRITLSIMGNYTSNSMDLRTKTGANFTTQSGGLGDFTLAGIFKILNKNKQSLHGNVGLSVPIADIDQRDVTPMSDNAQLAYAMQLGSGTWDPSVGFTYLGQADKFSWGAQSKYKLRIGENSEDYTLGNRFDAVGWAAIRVANHLSFSTSLSYFDIQSIDGMDPDLNPMMMPLFNTVNSGRSQVDVGFGVNLSFPKKVLEGLRIAAEVKLPIQQIVNGIQMKNSVGGTVGIQYAIGHRNHIE